jgi:hypothetical protein
MAVYKNLGETKLHQKSQLSKKNELTFVNPKAYSKTHSERPFIHN